MPFHLTIEPDLQEDGLTAEDYAERVRALKPVTVLVDCSGIGRTVLASLQAKGINAQPLERDLQRENDWLRGYRDDVHALIRRLE